MKDSFEMNLQYPINTLILKVGLWEVKKCPGFCPHKCIKPLMAS